MPETLILPLKTLFLTSQLLRKLQSHLLQSQKQRLHPLPSPRTNLRKNPANLKNKGKRGNLTRTGDVLQVNTRPNQGHGALEQSTGITNADGVVTTTVPSSNGTIFHYSASKEQDGKEEQQQGSQSFQSKNPCHHLMCRDLLDASNLMDRFVRL